MAFNIIVAFGIGIHFLEVSYELYSSQNVSRRAKTNIADLVSWGTRLTRKYYFSNVYSSVVSIMKGRGLNEKLNQPEKRNHNLLKRTA